MQGPEQPPEENISKVEELLASPALARVVESEEFKQFLDHVPIAVVVARAHGERHHRIVYCNGALETLLGRPASEIEGKGWSVLDGFRHEDDAQRTLGQAIANEEDFLGCFVAERKEGSTAVEAYAGVIQQRDGTENYRIAALVDVSARDRAQREEFLRKIHDRDLLLKELQHRVRNNLQLIVALIRLESRAMRQGERVDLDRLARRIDALAILYRALSAEPEVQQIDLGQYLSEIATAATHGHGVEGIRLDLKAETCPTPIDIAMPMGLVVNEILTNSFKHAFADRQAGTITVSCLRRGDECHVLVADDGPGLPEGTVWPMPGKISDLMVHSLRENAKAEVEVVSQPGLGVRVSILFKIPTPKAH